jgi:hypothetical protein
MCLLFLSDFNQTGIISTDFIRKAPNVKFHENPPSEGRNFQRRLTDGRTDTTNLSPAFTTLRARIKTAIRESGIY